MLLNIPKTVCISIRLNEKRDKIMKMVTVWKKYSRYFLVLFLICYTFCSSPLIYRKNIPNDELRAKIIPKSSLPDDFKTDPNTIDWGTSGTPNVIVPASDMPPDKCDVIPDHQGHSFPLEFYHSAGGAPHYGRGRSGYLISDSTAVNTSIWINSNDLTEAVVYFLIGNWPYDKLLAGICINDGYLYYYDSQGDHNTNLGVEENEWNHIQLEWDIDLGFRAFWNDVPIFSGFKLGAQNVNAQAIMLMVQSTTAFYDALVVNTTEATGSTTSDSISTTSSLTSDTSTSTSDTSTTTSISGNDSGSEIGTVIGIISVVSLLVFLAWSRNKSSKNDSKRTSFVNGEITPPRISYNAPPKIVAIPVPIPVAVSIQLEDKEKILLEKFKSILEITQEVEFSRVARSLKISEDNLFDKMLKWKETIPFKIRGKMVVVENMGNFMAALDDQFSDWDTNEDRNDGKI